MRIIDLMDTAHHVVECSARAKRWENVLVITDTETSPIIAQSLAAAAHMIGAVPTVVTILRLSYPAADMPENVAAAVAASEVIIAPTSQPITHSKTVQDAIFKHHRRFVSMPGITEAMMVTGASTVEPHMLEVSHGDANTYRIGEFAVGTNPEAQLIGSVGEDKNMLGTIHFSLGDNALMGDLNQSKLHLDGVVLYPTL